MKKDNRFKILLQSKTAAFIIAVLIFLTALVVNLEIIEPLIILFVIYCSLNFAKKGAVYSTLFAVFVLALQDLYTLDITISEYLIEVLAIIIAAIYIVKSTSRIKDLNFNLKERVKELAGLYRISRATEEARLDVEKLLKGIVKEIPPSYQYPEDCEACIIYKGEKYKTSNFEETEWIQQKNIEFNNQIVGKIMVSYLSQHPLEYQETVFLKEEFDLLDSITSKVTNVLKNLEQEREIKEQRQFLSVTLNSIGDGLIVTDNQGRIKRLNSITEELTGWTLSEAEGKEINEVLIL